jgi:hypothetical protein
MTKLVVYIVDEVLLLLDSASSLDNTIAKIQMCHLTKVSYSSKRARWKAVGLNSHDIDEHRFLLLLLLLQPL